MDSMKTVLNEVHALYEVLFLDLSSMHPTISADLKRDLSRLLKSSVSCGLPFFTIVLPSVSKWFENCLDEGRLIDPRPPHFGVRVRASDSRPRLLTSLFSQIFEPDGTLRSSLDISCIQSLRNVLLLCKKLNLECEERYTNESISSFHEIERSLPKPREGTWNSNIPSWTHLAGHPIWGDCTEFNSQASLFDSPIPMLQLDFDPDWEGFRRFSARVLSQFGSFDPFAVRPKHGPGAVSDRSDGFVKYDFAFWPEKLDQVFPYDWHASSSLSVPEYAKSTEYPSKLVAVPKTASGPRLIAAEPTSHQWIQQGIWRWLEEGLAKSLLRKVSNFRSQHRSREMALEASVHGDSATVDLSSASDRLTCRLVEYIFQVNRPLLDGLHACRTRALVDQNGEMILLSKYSTQGNATIFPIQTICYGIIALWAMAITRGCKDYRSISSTANQVRVFGDDIIVPTDVYPVLKGLLETLLLKVNVSKTHASGFFRESCGMDAYRGVDVTPGYLREVDSATPEALMSIIETSNNFYKKGYWNIADALIKTIPEKERKLIPVGKGLGSIALLSAMGEDWTHLRKRVNPYTFCEEYRHLDVDVKVRRDEGNGEGGLTQYLFEMPSPLVPYSSGQPAKPVSRKRARWSARKGVVEVQLPWQSAKKS